jgi:diguanylate cyclase (GGDEF)-like protein
MPGLNAPAAMKHCEVIRGEIQSKSQPKFTISCGVSTFPYDGKSFSSLLEYADRGLYKSKELGRNRVEYQGNVFIQS